MMLKSGLCAPSFVTRKCSCRPISNLASSPIFHQPSRPFINHQPPFIYGTLGHSCRHVGTRKHGLRTCAQAAAVKYCIFRRRLILTLSSYLTYKVVIVKAGQDAIKDFHIREETLTRHSRFFKNAVDNMPKGSQSLVINLPGSELEVFSLYADWLYDGTPDTQFIGLANNTSLSYRYKSVTKVYQILADLYLFGEKILDAKFCNAVMRGFVDSTTRTENPRYGEIWFKNVEEGGDDGKEEDENHHEVIYQPQYSAAELVPARIVNAVYDGTTLGSPIRRFLVDKWVSESFTGCKLADGIQLHPRFARDLVKVFLAMPSGGDRWEPGEPVKISWLKMFTYP